MQLLDDNEFLHGNTLYYYTVHYSSNILLGTCRFHFGGIIRWFLENQCGFNLV